VVEGGGSGEDEKKTDGQNLATGKGVKGPVQKKGGESNGGTPKRRKKVFIKLGPTGQRGEKRTAKDWGKSKIATARGCAKQKFVQKLTIQEKKTPWRGGNRRKTAGMVLRPVAAWVERKEGLLGGQGTNVCK